MRLTLPLPLSPYRPPPQPTPTPIALPTFSLIMYEFINYSSGLNGDISRPPLVTLDKSHIYSTLLTLPTNPISYMHFREKRHFLKSANFDLNFRSEGVEIGKI